MTMKDKAPTWLEPWHEFNLDSLSADMQQKVLAERQRWQQDVEARQRARETLLNRLVASIDIITSTTLPNQPFFSLDTTVDITARAITAALHDIPTDEAHTSEYWADTCARHRERLRALVELGRLPVFDLSTGSTYVYESGLPDWTQCDGLGLVRSGAVDFARCQGVEVRDAQESQHKGTKKQNTMLKVMAALIQLRHQPRSELAISKEIENWTQQMGEPVSARTVTNYLREIEESLGWSRRVLGLNDRENTPN
ncbi:hypothetical protein [Burkholderia sp. BE17]|uniref:hypothetical protein n=1 Tax=Burkholderia sp. BE17 TaxID=2656644 RepID=UPI00128D58E7|nr:hypothetical protein [Burkholderia sp. BE17]MPV64383.1 hypothetical protein [Burkholderia sp. BE17]